MSTEYMTCRKGDVAPDDIGLTNGHWQKRHGVSVWVKHECRDCGGFLAPGDRCETCLTWAVKNARDAEWARISWENRGVIWDVLDARKQTGAHAA